MVMTTISSTNVNPQSLVDRDLPVFQGFPFCSGSPERAVVFFVSIREKIKDRGIPATVGIDCRGTECRKCNIKNAKCKRFANYLIYQDFCIE